MNDILKEKRLKITKPRKAIMRIITEAKEPISAEDIYMKAMQFNIKMNLSTIYRNLEILEKSEVINKLSLEGEDKQYYDLKKKIHCHYLVCLSCKKVIPLLDCPLEDYEKEVENKTGFLITGHNFEFYGYCSDCLKKIKRT